MGRLQGAARDIGRLQIGAENRTGGWTARAAGLISRLCSIHFLRVPCCFGFFRPVKKFARRRWVTAALTSAVVLEKRNARRVPDLRLVARSVRVGQGARTVAEQAAHGEAGHVGSIMAIRSAVASGSGSRRRELQVDEPQAPVLMTSSMTLQISDRLSVPISAVLLSNTHSLL